jgi:hypothetical protein
MPFTRKDDLRLSIRMGLTKGLRLIRGMRRQLDEDERNRVAEAIRETPRVSLANWKIERRARRSVVQPARRWRGQSRRRRLRERSVRSDEQPASFGRYFSGALVKLSGGHSNLSPSR